MLTDLVPGHQRREPAIPGSIAGGEQRKRFASRESRVDSLEHARLAAAVGRRESRPVELPDGKVDGSPSRRHEAEPSNLGSTVGDWNGLDQEIQRARCELLS